MPAARAAEEVRSGGAAPDELEVHELPVATHVPEQPAEAVDVVEARIALELDPRSRRDERGELEQGLASVALAVAELRRVDLDEADATAVEEEERVAVPGGRDDDAVTSLNVTAPAVARASTGCEQEDDPERRAAPHARIFYARPVQRCAWVPLGDPLYVAYHDDEWGAPVRDDRTLFELLNLEGAQAGLSWATILHKREGYRRAFAGWDVEAVARFGERDVERLLGDAGIVRHRGKIEAAIGNARAALALDRPLAELLWSFVGGETRVNAWRTVAQIPSSTPESAAMSTELKRRGFRFTGPKTCYALMQAAGLVDDHTVDCFRRAG